MRQIVARSSALGRTVWEMGDGTRPTDRAITMRDQPLTAGGSWKQCGTTDDVTNRKSAKLAASQPAERIVLGRRLVGADAAVDGCRGRVLLHPLPQKRQRALQTHALAPIVRLVQ